MSARVFAGYSLLRVLGRGGSASVVEAEAPDGSEVALKIPHPHVQGDHLEREAARAMVIQSPHVVRVLGLVREGRDRGLVLELVRGETLSKASANTRWDIRRVARVALDISTGLAAIHDADVDGEPLGLVHGDVSPENVLIDEHGRAKLTDLGLSRRRALSAISLTGTLHGTVGYIAPEVIRGAPVTPRSDVFALGVVIWELLCGVRAFEGSTDLERLRATVERPLTIPDGPLATWLTEMTHKRAERRPPDGSHAARAIEAIVAELV